MSKSEYIDLIIVGAGPAGLSTAMHLLKIDPSWKDRLIILEKSEHPRSKICGGGITRFGLKILRELGFSLPLPLSQDIVNNIKINYHKRTIHVRGEPQFIVFNRPELDQYLATIAKSRGVRIRENEEVKSLEVLKDRIKVCTTKRSYETAVVVGADGSSSLVRKYIQGKHQQMNIARTLKVWTRGTFSSPRFKGRSAIFDFSNLSIGFRGYIWDFPNRIGDSPGYNQGVYESRMVKTKPEIKLTNILENVISRSDNKAEKQILESAPIHWFNPNNTISDQRIILIGDAAGVDVLFGEGISPALGYGKIASIEIDHAFRKKEFSLKGYKTNLLLSGLGRYFFIRWLLAALIYRLGHIPFFTHTLWSISQVLAYFWRPGQI